MNKIILSILLLVVSLSAEITDRNKSFTLLCIEDAAVGFNWVKGKWEKTNFTQSKYLVKKLSLDKCDATKEMKELPIMYDWNKDSKINSRKGCYNIRNHGSEFTKWNTKSCYEEWYKKGDKFYLDTVNCDRIGMQPNGKFIKSQLPLSVNNIHNNPSNGNKDSIFVSHGKCSEL